jgi:hypothetical protein
MRVLRDLGNGGCGELYWSNKEADRPHERLLSLIWRCMIRACAGKWRCAPF